MLFVITADRIVALAPTLHQCLTDPDHGCERLPTEWWVFQLLRLVFPIVIGLAFWASLSHTRTRLAVAATIAVLALETIFAFFWTVYDDRPGWEWPLEWAILDFVVLAATGLLLASYRGHPPLPDEHDARRHRSAWWPGAVALPLLGFDVYATFSEQVRRGPVLLLAAITLYGAYRWAQPLAGAAPGAPVAATLASIALPSQIYITYVIEDGEVYASRIVLAATVLTAFTLAGWHISHTRSRTGNPPDTPPAGDPPAPGPAAGPATAVATTGGLASTPRGAGGGAAQPATDSAGSAAAATGGD